MRLLYLFKADSGTKSPCATAWPAAAGHRHADADTRLIASKLASIAGSRGTRQVTYNGHPLYVYLGDLITLRS